VNERVARVAETFQVFDEPYDFLCECGVTGCRTPVAATIAEYDRVRSHPSTWLLAPGHENDHLEEVVYRTEHFVVVRVVGYEPVPVGLS
jgi:hypothetical protein